MATINLSPLSTAACPTGALRMRRQSVALVAPLLGRLRSAKPFAREGTTQTRSMVMSVDNNRNADRQAVAAAPQLCAGSIWPAICERYTDACHSGAASKTDTTVEVFREPTPAGTSVDWVLRLAAALNKKPKGDAPPLKSEAKGLEKLQKAFFNPFDPPEPSLTVGHLSSTHSLVLNKFNVVAHHSIVITRTFQPQTDPLNAEDLDAAYQVLQDMPHGGLAFFNCGEHSGRSQPHKHVQIVPLPFVSGKPAEMPLAAALLAATEGRGPGEAAEARDLPFQAYVCRLGDRTSPEHLTASFDSLYAAAFGAVPPEEDVSYNWIGCRDFMAFFPRSQEKAEILAVNALGFAGTLLFRSKEEVAFAKEFGCLNILQRVGLPW